MSYTFVFTDWRHQQHLCTRCKLAFVYLEHNFNTVRPVYVLVPVHFSLKCIEPFLYFQNEALTLQCHNLQLEKIQLATENQELHQKLSSLECNHQTHGVGCSTQFEPAEFSMDPLLQGQALQRALGPKSQVLTMWRIIIYCLPSQISLIILMEMCAYLTWMNWHRACSGKLQKKWMQRTDKPLQKLVLFHDNPQYSISCFRYLCGMLFCI